MRVFSRCESPLDIARVAAVSLLFHASLAEEGIRLWVRERGYELPAQPEDESCTVRWLCFSALLRETRRRGRRQAGGTASSATARGGSCRVAVRMWDDVQGLLGHGNGVRRLRTPTRHPSTLGGERAVSVSAGRGHSLALTADGSVWSWGFGAFGKLGHGDEEDQWQPKKVEAFAGQRLIAVSGGRFSLAITADGAVWSWGLGDFGRLGHGGYQNQLLLKEVEALAGRHVVAVSAGETHSLALTADGSVWSWGYGSRGMLGHGDQQDQLLPKKVETLAGQRVLPVSAGQRHSTAIIADGADFTWGKGRCGCLGHGDDLSKLLPKKIEGWAPGL